MLLFVLSPWLVSVAAFAAIRRGSLAPGPFGPLALPRRPFPVRRLLTRAPAVLADARSSFSSAPSLAEPSEPRVDTSGDLGAALGPDEPPARPDSGAPEEPSAVQAGRGAAPIGRTGESDEAERGIQGRDPTGPSSQGPGSPLPRRDFRNRSPAAAGRGLGLRARCRSLATPVPRLAGGWEGPGGARGVFPMVAARRQGRAMVSLGTRARPRGAAAPSPPTGPETAWRDFEGDRSITRPGDEERRRRASRGTAREREAIDGCTGRRPNVRPAARLTPAGGVGPMPLIGFSRPFSDVHSEPRSGGSPGTGKPCGSGDPTTFGGGTASTTGPPGSECAGPAAALDHPAARPERFRSGVVVCGRWMQTRNGVRRTRARRRLEHPSRSTAEPARCAPAREPRFPCQRARTAGAPCSGAVNRCVGSSRWAGTGPSDDGRQRHAARGVSRGAGDRPIETRGTSAPARGATWERPARVRQRSGPPPCGGKGLARPARRGERVARLESPRRSRNLARRPPGVGAGPGERPMDRGGSVEPQRGRRVGAKEHDRGAARAGDRRAGANREAPETARSGTAVRRHRCTTVGPDHYGSVEGGRRASYARGRSRRIVALPSPSAGRRKGRDRGGAALREEGPARTPSPGSLHRDRTTPPAGAGIESLWRPGFARESGLGRDQRARWGDSRPISERRWSEKLDVPESGVHIVRSRPGPRVATTMRSGSESMRKTWIRPRVTSRPVGMEVTMYLPAEL